MDITIKKVGERDGLEQFILVNARSREVLTTVQVSEAALRRFFDQHGVDSAVVDQSLERARSHFAAVRQAGSVPDDSETAEDTDLLFDLGLSDDEDVH